MLRYWHTLNNIARAETVLSSFLIIFAFIVILIDLLTPGVFVLRTLMFIGLTYAILGLITGSLGMGAFRTLSWYKCLIVAHIIMCLITLTTGLLSVIELARYAAVEAGDIDEEESMGGGGKNETRVEERREEGGISFVYSGGDEAIGMSAFAFFIMAVVTAIVLAICLFLSMFFTCLNWCSCSCRRGSR